VKLFSGMIESVGLMELETGMRLPKDPIHFVSNEAQISEDKARRVSLIFNPFSMSAISRLVSINKTRTAKAEVFIGEYEVDTKHYKFQYATDSKQYRVPYDVWSDRLGIVNYRLSCYDLVAYYDFWHAPYKELTLKTWYPQLFKPVDQDKVRAITNYDICNNLGRIIDESKTVMACGSSGLSEAVVHECLVVHDGQPCELEEDFNGKIVPVREQFSGSVVFIGPLDADEIKKMCDKRGRRIKTYKMVPQFTSQLGGVTDVICASYERMSVYYPRTMRTNLRKVVKNRRRDVLMKFDKKLMIHFDLIKVVMTFFPTDNCYFSEQECYVAFDGDPFDMIGALMNMGKHSLFRAECHFMKIEAEYQELKFGVSDDD